VWCSTPRAPLDAITNTHTKALSVKSLAFQVRLVDSVDPEQRKERKQGTDFYVRSRIHDYFVFGNNYFVIGFRS